jgi:16S rRNA (guanine966-N2)-methyltransferase
MSKQKTRYQNSVRIIGGSWRGRRIPIPGGTGVRPTPDRVRETLFNWLAGVVEGARCLDLFAGSGALGLEALSRGAAEVCFVESNPTLARSLGERISAFGAQGTILHADVTRILERTKTGPYDLVFVDPPYELALAPILKKLVPRLSPGALVYMERAETLGSSDEFQHLTSDLAGCDLVKLSRAGKVRFGLWRFGNDA